MKQHLLVLTGAVLVAGAVLIAQQPAAPPQAGGPGAGRGGAGGGPGGRGGVQYQLEKGKPIDIRASTKADDHSLWEGQTRAPYEPSGVAYTVTTVTDKLVAPWAIAFLPDGKMLVTEKQGNMRVVSADGTVSEPLAGVPKVHYQGQVGLLDLGFRQELRAEPPHLFHL
jgi:glucose/arabinose dehydrogenase